MKNIASVFQLFLLLLPGFLLILVCLPYPKGMVELVFLFVFTIKKKNIFEKSRTVRIIWQNIFGTSMEKLWREKNIRSENNLAYMEFLADIYKNYIKTWILLKHSILVLLYHLRKQKNEKRRTFHKRKLNFSLCDVLGFLIWYLKVEIR